MKGQTLLSAGSFWHISVDLTPGYNKQIDQEFINISGSPWCISYCSNECFHSDGVWTQLTGLDWPSHNSLLLLCMKVVKGNINFVLILVVSLTFGWWLIRNISKKLKYCNKQNFYNGKSHFNKGSSCWTWKWQHATEHSFSHCSLLNKCLLFVNLIRFICDDDALPVGCLQGRLQDGQRAEECWEQEVRLQWCSAPQLPQTVSSSERQLQMIVAHIGTFTSCTDFKWKNALSF